MIKKLLNFINMIFFSWIGLLFWSLLLLNVGYRHFIVPSESMEKTLMVGDIYIGNMHKYGIVMPTLYGINLSESRIIYQYNEPELGDVVIFSKPGSSELFVKRVFAKGGDLVEIIKDDFYLNGKKNPYSSYVEYKDINITDLSKLKFNMKKDGDKFYLTVPDNEYFMLGDNRNNSIDSRFFGTIPQNKIIGKAKVRIFSMQDKSNYKEIR